DSYSKRLEGFRVRTFDKDNNIRGFYKDRNLSSQRIYYISLNGSVNLPVNLVSISLEGTNRILTLCEVEVYGECPAGFWSLPCSQQCPTSCPYDCDRDTGECNSICIEHSNPPHCDAACRSGEWGINCGNNCSSRCAEVSCYVKTGQCDQGCQGYSDPPYCETECKTRIYGTNCTSNCSSACLYGECDPRTGHCYNCLPSFHGYFCERKIFNVELISFGMGYAACSGLTIVVILALALSRTIVCQCNARSRLEPVQHHTDLQQDICHDYDQREIAEYGDAVSEPKYCNYTSSKVPEINLHEYETIV
ncbi:platelet endothelial aggregation receptor 1, partial [Biomphalaria pfeifferi]